MRGRLRRFLSLWRSRQRSTPDAAGDLLYRDYRLFVLASGTGWRVVIHAPGSPFACMTVPEAGTAATRDEALAAARIVVDRLLASR